MKNLDISIIMCSYHTFTFSHTYMYEKSIGMGSPKFWFQKHMDHSP